MAKKLRYTICVPIRHIHFTELKLYTLTPNCLDAKL